MNASFLFSGLQTDLRSRRFWPERAFESKVHLDVQNGWNGLFTVELGLVFIFFSIPAFPAVPFVAHKSGSTDC